MLSIVSYFEVGCPMVADIELIPVKKLYYKFGIKDFFLLFYYRILGGTQIACINCKFYLTTAIQTIFIILKNSIK